MSLSLDEHRCRFINKILMAASQQEVKRHSAAVMRELEQHKTAADQIVLFVDRMIRELGEFNPMNKDSQQWSNIQMARILFNRIKQQISFPTI